MVGEVLGMGEGMGEVMGMGEGMGMGMGVGVGMRMCMFEVRLIRLVGYWVR